MCECHRHKICRVGIRTGPSSWAAGPSPVRLQGAGFPNRFLQCGRLEIKRRCHHPMATGLRWPDRAGSTHHPSATRFSAGGFHSVSSRETKRPDTSITGGCSPCPHPGQPHAENKGGLGVIEGSGAGVGHAAPPPLSEALSCPIGPVPVSLKGPAFTAAQPRAGQTGREGGKGLPSGPCCWGFPLAAATSAL